MTTTVQRMSDGTPRRFTDLGCYPIFYVDAEMCVCCPACAAEDESTMVAIDVNWEDDSLFCDCCSERIESAYAEQH